MALCRRSSRFNFNAFHRCNSNTGTAPVRFYSPGNSQSSRNPRNGKLITRCFIGFGFATSVYFWNLETVPYTKRTHSVPMPTYLVKQLAEILIPYIAEEYEWKILPSNHPLSIRVQKVGEDIIGALLKGLRKGGDNRQIALFEGFKWELIVVDEPDTVYAMYILGGKIVVYTGLLDYHKTDAEIAATIGHEVGHAAARHGEEAFCGILRLMMLVMFMPDFVEEMVERYVWLPYSRRFRGRDEIEADYIGLLLMASAGYDPRVAVEVREKLDKIDCSMGLDGEEDIVTHPRNKKRAQLLSEPKVMDEALSLYREAVKDKDKHHPPLNFFNRLIAMFSKS